MRILFAAEGHISVTHGHHRFLVMLQVNPYLSLVDYDLAIEEWEHQVCGSDHSTGTCELVEGNVIIDLDIKSDGGDVAWLVLCGRP